MTVFISIFLGFILAMTAPVLFRWLKHRAAYPLAVYPLVVFVFLLMQLQKVRQDEAVRWAFDWISRFDLRVSFQLDGLGIVMALLISGIGAMVVLYGGSYLKGDPKQGRFFSWVLVFMSAMLGITASDNAILLFVFWELTSISSYFLIGYKHDEERSRAAAWQALLVTGTGGLVMMAGLVLTGLISGSFEISQWIQNADSIALHPLANTALVLVLIGAMTKSAQFPFHFWLPNAMEAPTPVSAYLHSATMVKAGVFLIARLLPVFGGLALWSQLVPWVGLVTMLVGALLALGQNDLKRLLAYTTISALGMLFFFFGQTSELAVKTGVLFLITHALYKGALFLVAGGIDHASGSRDVRRLGNLLKPMPLTALAGGLAALSMAGLPPLIGFIAKELFYETTLGLPQLAVLVTALAVFANLANVAVAGWTGLAPFWRKQNQLEEVHHEEVGLWLPPLVLSTGGLLLGLFPAFTGSQFLAPAVTAVTQNAAKIKLSLWHGINPMLILSIVTVLLGIGLYVLLIQWRSRLEKVNQLAGRVGPDRGYQRGLNGILRFAVWQTRKLQSGYLRVYVIWIVMTTVGLAALTFLLRLDGLRAVPWEIPRYFDVVFIAIILAAAILVTRARSRLATIAILGSIGFSIAILFLLYSAPDLAMVQFAIETLTVILFVLVIYRLPKFSRESGRPTRLQDILVSVSGGALMTMLMLLVSVHNSESLLTTYFAESSLPLANGRNMVNVILVDFRGLDTLGEITVLAIAAIGVFALVHLVIKSKNNSNQEENGG